MMSKMKNLWCFISISSCCLTNFKFSGASKLHDPTTNMKIVQIKDKGKLNGIIKNQPMTHITLLFLFEVQKLWLNLIFEKKTFLPFITSDRNSNCLRWWKTEKNSEDKFDSHKKNRNEQSAHYGMPSEASRFFRYYDYRITLLLWHTFFTHIKDWSAKIY